MNLKKLALLTASVSMVFATTLSAKDSLMMATTTSTDNTGLLDYLAPIFEKETGTNLKWVATGTGKALKMGGNCDVDILFVHAPASEKKFIATGFGGDTLLVLVVLQLGSASLGVCTRHVRACVRVVGWRGRGPRMGAECGGRGEFSREFS